MSREAASTAPARVPSSRRARELPWVISLGALLVALLSIEIGAPWRYIHDDNGAWTQAVATARIRAGIAETKGQDFFLRRGDDSLVPYLHHPPLYGTIAALAYRVTGRADPLATRLLPAAFHVAGFIGVAFLARRLYPRDGLRRRVSLFVYATVPMSSFFGKMPFNEPVALALIIWAIVATLRHVDRGTAASIVAALSLWALAVLTAWTAFVLALSVAAWLAIEARRSGRRRAMRTAGALAAGSIVSEAFVLAHLAWAGAGHESTLLAVAGHWGAHRLAPGEIVRRIGKLIDFNRMYFANVPFLFFLGWLVRRARDAASGLDRLTPARRLLGAGTAGCAAWALVFLRQTTVHAYGQFWLLPFESLAVGDLAAALWRRLGSRRAKMVGSIVAVAGTAASVAWTLDYRYSKPHGYAVETARRLSDTYYSAPHEP